MTGMFGAVGKLDAFAQGRVDRRAGKGPLSPPKDYCSTLRRIWRQGYKHEVEQEKQAKVEVQ
jgi:hypothetical protein